MSTDTDGCLGGKAKAAVVKRSYFMGLSRACPWFGKDMSSLSWVPPVFWTGKYVVSTHTYTHFKAFKVSDEGEIICTCRDIYVR